jgi:acetyl esterase/lipase
VAPSFTRNAHRDVLSARFLRTVAERFIGPTNVTNPTFLKSPFLEFLDPDPATDWDAVLPPWIWVSAGEHEILFDDIIMWTDRLKQELGDQRVHLELGRGECHVWQWLETMDEGRKREFLAKETSARRFEAIERVGRLIGERFGRSE